MLEYVQNADNNDRVVRGLTGMIVDGQTPFQRYQIFSSPTWGKVVVIDNDVQSTEYDERLYHELLVHPPMLLHPNPKRVLVMGGGEGATAREVLKHSTVEECVMVDIDREFCEMCREHLRWDDGAYDDSRFTVVYDDIRAYLQQASGSFDVVIGDLVDVQDNTDGPSLYGEEFFRMLLAGTSEQFRMSTQASTLSPNAIGPHNEIRRELSKVVDRVASYGYFVPSFYQNWGYCVGGDASLDPLSVAERLQVFNQRVAERGVNLQASGAETLACSFVLPANVTGSIEA